MIKLEHGAGGLEMIDFIAKYIASKVPPHMRNTPGGYGLDFMDDGAVIDIGGGVYLVLTIDSYTVKPPRFPGGDIGKLAASGTINDLLMMGGRPLALVDAVVVEEGTSETLVEEVIESFVSTVAQVGAHIVGGDFKVMPKGSIDGIVVTSSGIGIARTPLVDRRIRAGDVVVVSGPIADHGAVIAAAQLGLLDKVSGLISDVKPLHDLMLPLIDRFGELIHAAKDPTRGGLASVLYEWVRGTQLTIVIDRDSIPIREATRKFLELLGVDPLNSASEGVAVLALPRDIYPEALEFIKSLGYSDAAVVGEVIDSPTDFLRGRVIAKTEIGGYTLVEPSPLLTPRIC
ncbi:MAG: hydrogenase expression/formation protein HypE [Sulfolobales archaeon]|nr:hydrogenase expression/formation protein HypE [Sulfolobales archaeon]MDW8082228.1 hydrogenase expression/formation protein HypE [Sulfolobales archaeon]